MSHTQAIRALGIGGPATLPRARDPRISQPWHLWVAGVSSAAFMSSFFHVELHLVDKNSHILENPDLWARHPGYLILSPKSETSGQASALGLTS
jgi:hypothetical protein